MSKIKVIVNDLEQANEMVDFWKDKEVNFEIVVKENTTAENSDVVERISELELTCYKNTTAENSDVKRKPSRTTVVQCGKLIELD